MVRVISLFTPEFAFPFPVFPFNVKQCDVTDTLLPQLNDRSAEHDTILESYAKIDNNKFKKGNTLHKQRCAAQYSAQQ